MASFSKRRFAIHHFRALYALSSAAAEGSMARINLAAKTWKHPEANRLSGRRLRRSTNLDEMPHWFGRVKHGRHSFRVSPDTGFNKFDRYDRRRWEEGGNAGGGGGIYRPGSSGGGGNAGGIYRPASGGGGGNESGIYRPASGGGGNGNESGIYRPASGGGGNAGGIYYPGSSGSGNVGGIYGEHNIIIINNFDCGNSGRPVRHPWQEDDDDEEESGSNDDDDEEEEEEEEDEYDDD